MKATVMFRRNVRGRFVAASVLLAGTMLAAGSAPLVAQSTELDPRWQAWLGCWQPARDPDAPMLVGDVKVPLTCVVPVPGSTTIDLVTVVEGKAASRQRIAATGRQRAMMKEGCSGWERADWSSDGRRVYLRSDFTCPGGLKRSSSGLIAMSPDGEWLDLEGISVGGNAGVRVLRYEEATDTTGLPSEIVSALRDRRMAVHAARADAGASLSNAAVLEATRQLDAPVVEAWLVTRGEGFDVDAERLVELADAGVPASVIDLMVALSYPQVFAVNAATNAAELRRMEAAQAAEAGRTGPVAVIQSDPFGYSRYDYYSPYGYSTYGYSPYGNGYGWYPGTRLVVIVVRQPGDSEAASHGRVVKGRGYSQGKGERSGSGAARSDGSSSGAKGSSAGSTGSSKPSVGSSDKGSSGRTAKPRKPD